MKSVRTDKQIIESLSVVAWPFLAAAQSGRSRHHDRRVSTVEVRVLLVG